MDLKLNITLIFEYPLCCESVIEILLTRVPILTYN